MKSTKVKFECGLLALVFAGLFACHAEAAFGSRLTSGSAAAMSGEDFLELCEEGSLQQIKDAIENGANVNAKDRLGTTPLHVATWKPRPELITVLLEAGADVNAKDGEDWTALTNLVSLGTSYPEAVTALIRAGADVEDTMDTLNWTPLMWAVVYNPNREEITALIEAGADVNAEGFQGWTPFMMAMKYATPEVTSAFLKAGANVNAEDHYGWSALMSAAASNPNPEIITALVKAGADVNAIEASDRTALMFAAESNSNPDIIRTLIENGADVIAEDHYGKTALDYAEDNENLKGTEAYNLLREKTHS
jgi:ankyrin repeat protein